MRNKIDNGLFAMEIIGTSVCLTLAVVDNILYLVATGLFAIALMLNIKAN